MEEIWKDIEGYEGIYQVSNLGRVKGLERYDSNGHLLKEKILKTSINRDGYEKVSIQKNAKKKTYKIHRLVAIAFIPNVENKKEVNHIDGNKLNNRVNNLEWCTKEENERHARNNNLIPVTDKIRKQASINGKKRRKSVEQYNTKGSLLKRYISVSEASRETGVSISGISNCCTKKSKIAGGYIWKYN